MFLLSRDDALLKKQMVDVFPALDGVFKFGPFCRPASHRLVGTSCHSNWSSSHTRAIQHCYVTTNAVHNCFSTNRALSIGVLISFEHHIDAHHINTLMHDCCHRQCDRAGWMEEVTNVVSLSINHISFTTTNKGNISHLQLHILACAHLEHLYLHNLFESPTPSFVSFPISARVVQGHVQCGEESRGGRTQSLNSRDPQHLQLQHFQVSQD